MVKNKYNIPGISQSIKESMKPFRILFNLKNQVQLLLVTVQSKVEGIKIYLKNEPYSIMFVLYQMLFVLFSLFTYLYLDFFHLIFKENTPI